LPGLKGFSVLHLHQVGQARFWTDQELTLIQRVAQQLSIALTQAQLVSQLTGQTLELFKTVEVLQETQMYLIQSEKMASLGQLVAGIAHEINTPLGVLSGNNHTLMQCVQHLQAAAAPDTLLQSWQKTQPILDELLSFNSLAIDRMLDTVKSLRNFARLDESDIKRVNINDGIQSTLKLVKSAFPPGLSIVYDIEPNLPEVECYPGLLNQVFMNLMLNAAHAMQQIPQPVLTIQVSYQADKQQLLITVQDNGKGIPPLHLGRIFDPGFTTKGVGVGTGLGLAISYRIMEKHHGQILVTSQSNLAEPDHGTTFQLLLPLSLSSHESQS
jgi:signal transduction histidine kinase